MAPFCTNVHMCLFFCSLFFSLSIVSHHPQLQVFLIFIHPIFRCPHFSFLVGSRHRLVSETCLHSFTLPSQVSFTWIRLLISQGQSRSVRPSLPSGQSFQPGRAWPTAPLYWYFSLSFSVVTQGIDHAEGAGCPEWYLQFFLPSLSKNKPTSSSTYQSCCLRVFFKESSLREFCLVFYAI